MRVFLTGGTGFLGEYLLAELLERNHDVWVLYRNNGSRLDTVRFLSALGLPKSTGSLVWIQGDVLETLDRWEEWCTRHRGLREADTVLHCAASTRLHLDKNGEPVRTNVGGAKVVRELVKVQPMKVHVISTAYVCGLVQNREVREVNHPRPDFVTVYEEAKWEMEQLWMGRATILRPSLIIGHSKTGRCTAFTGWYMLLHAAHLFARLMRGITMAERISYAIEIPADPDGTVNLVPVDYVAKATVKIVENPANHNRIFHLTHPAPPNHGFTREFVMRRFGLDGVRLVGAEAPFQQPRNPIERMVWRQMQTIRHYFVSSPRFDRANTDRAVPDLAPPPVTAEYLDRLVDYAVRHDWGQ